MAKSWIAWSRSFVLATALFAGTVFAFVAGLDPFGLRVGAGTTPRPIMDINQRFMYPQLVRSGAFDAAVVGTSTMRLIDPRALSRDLGAQFVNLAMNAATPWEQTQTARLFQQHVSAPRWLIWGLDQTWCESDATEPAKWRTPRPVPGWFSRDVGWLDWPRLLNLTNLEIAGRLLAYRLGLGRERIRADGYEVFTPPEASYDLARARSHLYAASGGEPVAPVQEAVVAVPEAARRAWRFPAVAWLSETLASYPQTTRVMLVLPPSHVTAFPQPGSVAGQRYAACKQAIATMAKMRDAVVVDYAHASPVTSEDSHYWDTLHFRLPVAQRVEQELAQIAKAGEPLSDGAARLTRR